MHNTNPRTELACRLPGGVMTRIKAIYIHGDGAIWKLNRAAMQAVADGAEFASVGRELASLPGALYRDEDGRIGVCAVGYALYSMDDINAEEAAHQLSMEGDAAARRAKAARIAADRGKRDAIEFADRWHQLTRGTP